MTKSTIAKTWIAGLIVLIAGLIVGGVSLGLMLAYGGTFQPAPSGNGSDYVPSLDATFWTTLTFMILGFTVALAGGVVQLVAWVGALVNTYQIVDKTWFIILLAGGLIGFGFSLVGLAVMIAYLIGGPDGTSARYAHAQPPTPPAPPAPPEPTMPTTPAPTA
ncbi:MAG TPA: hypothetical protein VJQ45_04645 [Ktedonobacterales bacterium]|nr:hypothetical protein [Ktedonobacterales bacterium]